MTSSKYPAAGLFLKLWLTPVLTPNLTRAYAKLTRIDAQSVFAHRRVPENRISGPPGAKRADVLLNAYAALTPHLRDGPRRATDRSTGRLTNGAKRTRKTPPIQLTRVLTPTLSRAYAKLTRIGAQRVLVHMHLE